MSTPATPSAKFDQRITIMRDEPIRSDRGYVLYWMSAARRTRYNFGLERAVALANQLGKPLLVYEALRAAYLHASARHHAFVIQGMRDNARALADRGVAYLPYVEPKADAGKGLISALCEDACVLIADAYPAFFLPRMFDAVTKQVSCRFELVESCCILPMQASEKAFSRAFDYRRFMQKNLLHYLERWPLAEPLDALKVKAQASVAKQILNRWPALSDSVLRGDDQALDAYLSEMPIDQDVGRVSSKTGGALAAKAQLDFFMNERFARYADDRSHPDQDASSNLSPWLHFGHMSPHEVFDAVREAEQWSLVDTAEKATAQREGWWGMSRAGEAYLDELISWREVGYHFCHHRDDAGSYDGLPDWARKSLEEHEGDPRWAEHSLETLERAKTEDPLWNAAQRQLVRDGIIHNALRMLWGKKVLGWSKNPRETFERLVYLNDKYALDGRDPNSYSGIGWVLGRFDRAWGPEREIFGKIRYMTSESSAKKWKLKAWLAEFGPKQTELFE